MTLGVGWLPRGDRPNRKIRAWETSLPLMFARAYRGMPCSGAAIVLRLADHMT